MAIVTLISILLLFLSCSIAVTVGTGLCVISGTNGLCSTIALYLHFKDPSCTHAEEMHLLVQSHTNLVSLVIVTWYHSRYRCIPLY